MIRVLAIDDEPLALRQLVTYISKVPYLQLCGECQNALEARAIIDREPIDAIFCDINMPDLNGMDFVKQLAAPPLIVFTTAYSEYAVEGYKVDAVDYLLKPFGLNDFQRAANKLRSRLAASLSDNSEQPAGSTAAGNDAEENDDRIFVKTEYKTVSIHISDIRFVEGMSEYLKLHVSGQPRPVITLMAMKKLEERLPSYFMRIHRSYIVNLRCIQEVNKNRVILDADTSLPIGDLYREQFNDYLATRLLGK